MKVRARLFGALAERAGTGEVVLDLPDGSSAGDVLDAVRAHQPDTAPLLGQISLAVNLETVSPDHTLADDDEVALLPPVAGGDTRILVGIRERSPSVEEALAAVAAPDAGGTVVFLGSVRDRSDDIGQVERLEYSAYQEMAEKVLREVAEEAAGRWPLTGVAVLHGVGDLSIGDHTVVVACSSAHRGEAFEACRYTIDEVKRRVPVWKKEVGPSGERWVGLEGGHSTDVPAP
jgi:molybdopterin synthase catalytic subunit/molybdopterin converting factor small subunit